MVVIDYFSMASNNANHVVDCYSKRIATLGLDAADPPPPRMLLLQRSIRLYISSFLQENMLGLQSLPTEEELVKRQEAKRQEIQRRIEAERRAAMEREQRRREEQQKQEEWKLSPTKNTNSKPVSEAKRPTELREGVASAGWKPMEVNHRGSDTEDPLVQQMNIIRGYIRQARQAQKWDEVQIFEDNLKELQAEYWRQHSIS